MRKLSPRAAQSHTASSRRSQDGFPGPRALSFMAPPPPSSDKTRAAQPATPAEGHTDALSSFSEASPVALCLLPRSQPLLIIENMKAKAFSLSAQHLPQLLSQTHPRPLRLPFCLLLRKRSSLKTLTLRLHTCVILTVFVLSSLSRRFWKVLELWNQPEGPCALCGGHPSPEVPPH